MSRHGLRRETVELDEKVWMWSLSMPKATKNMIQKYAKELFTQAGIDNFKASDGWYRRWRKRWKDEKYRKVNKRCKNEADGNVKHRNFTLRTTNNVENEPESFNGICNSININCANNQNIEIAVKNSVCEFSESDLNLDIKIINEKNISNSDDVLKKVTTKNSEIPIKDNANLSNSFDIYIDSNKRNAYVSDGTDIFRELLINKSVTTIDEFSSNEIAGGCDRLESCDEIFSANSSDVENDLCKLKSIINPNIPDQKAYMNEVFYNYHKQVHETNQIDSFNEVINHESICRNLFPFNNLSQTVVSDLNSNSDFYTNSLTLNTNSLTMQSTDMNLSNNLYPSNSDNFSVDSNIVQLNSSGINSFYKDKINISNSNLSLSNCSSINSNLSNWNYGINLNLSNQNVNELSSVNSNYSDTISNPNESSLLDVYSNRINLNTSIKSNLPVFDSSSIDLNQSKHDSTFTGSFIELDTSKNNSKLIHMDYSSLDLNIFQVDTNLNGVESNSSMISSNVLQNNSSVTDLVYKSNFAENNYSVANSDLSYSKNTNSNFVTPEIINSHSNGSETNASIVNNLSDPKKDKFSQTNLTKRVENNNSESPVSSSFMTTWKKGGRYLPQFKSKVIDFSKSHSIKSAAAKFKVCESTISEWIRAELRESEDYDLNRFKIVKTTSESLFINWLVKMRKEQAVLTPTVIFNNLTEIINKESDGDPGKIRKKSWIQFYLERLEISIGINENSLSSKKKHISFSDAFKTEVALYAISASQLTAARVFCVARKRVFEWLAILKNKGDVKNNKSDGSSYVTDPDVDKRIWTWYSSHSIPPTSLEVREMGRKLYKEKGFKVNCGFGWYYRWRKRFRTSAVTSSDSSVLKWALGKLDRNKYVSHIDLLEHALANKHSTKFKGSLGWAIRFCKRYTPLLQKTPSIETRLPPEMESKIIEFRKTLKEMQIDLGLDLDNIGSIDEIPLHFINGGVKTKDLLIRKPGFDNCHASVVLTCLANGQMLSTVLVFKGATDNTCISPSENVSVFWRKNGCVDEEIMLYWLNDIWFRHLPGVSLLTSDNYQPHTNPSFQNAVISSLCHHQLFPEGCSSKLQPLSLSISSSFKEKVEKCWRNQTSKSTWNDYLELPTHQNILSWVSQVHHEISKSCQDELKIAFQKTLFCES